MLPCVLEGGVPGGNPIRCSPPLVSFSLASCAPLPPPPPTNAAPAPAPARDPDPNPDPQAGSVFQFPVPASTFQVSNGHYDGNVITHMRFQLDS